jgi:hypothetical protein
MIQHNLKIQCLARIFLHKTLLKLNSLNPFTYSEIQCAKQ